MQELGMKDKLVDTRNPGSFRALGVSEMAYGRPCHPWPKAGYSSVGTTKGLASA